VLDARAAERYRGDTEPVDPRAGHIPGAANAPWQDNLDPATGRFLAPAALRARFEALGVRAGEPVVAYCGSGVSACADLVALERAGISGARLYVASWSGWSADPDRPAAIGDRAPPE
jgi:thiosulfate/3-mercaptopyruvate sulfurtransferase